ncbi:MAG TPA: prepilin peptidase [Chthoniobacterales bacterium]|nr:prepilin peptidase [Chthoniobacterales bacterium]
MIGPDLVLQGLWLVCVAAIGASIGSFLNVCIYRIPIGLGVTQPKRSFCPFCRTQIKAFDNIPVISWLLLRGRCRSCHAPIPAWYFLVELFAGIGSGLSYLKSGLLGAFLFLTVYCLLTYALRTARSGHTVKPRFLVLLVLLAALLYFQREAVLTNDLWKLSICCLSAVLILRSGYTEPVDRWWQRAIVFAAVLASGWLGALVAAVIFILYRNSSPNTKDAVSLACFTVGSFLA